MVVGAAARCKNMKSTKAKGWYRARGNLFGILNITNFLGDGVAETRRCWASLNTDTRIGRSGRRSLPRSHDWEYDYQNWGC